MIWVHRVALALFLLLAARSLFQADWLMVALWLFLAVGNIRFYWWMASR